MISAQIDELRERAKVLRQGRWSDGADDARLMEDAADTIWQLRDDLQRANNAVQEAEHDESMAWDRVRKAEAENAKLRELLAIASDMARDYDGDRRLLRELVRDLWSDLQKQLTPPWSGEYEQRMRELGVEVDG